MTPRQKYALTHPLDEFHMERRESCKRVREHDDGVWSITVLAVDR